MLRSISTHELQKELEFRAKNPQWFIRELVEDGFDLDNDDFRAATEWMDDDSFRVEE